MHKQANIGAIAVSLIVLAGFIIISFMAMKPEYAGVKQEVVLFLLGTWSTLAGVAVTYWLGSSASSKQKDDTIQAIGEKKL